MRRSLSELNLDEAQLRAKSKPELVALAQRLQAQARSMFQSVTYKHGDLERIRDTIIGVEDDQRRFYLLKPGWLLCFESETVRNLRGEIPLYESATIEAIDASSSSSRNGGGGGGGAGGQGKEAGGDPRRGRFCFAVRSKGQSLRFAADSAQEREDWIAALREAARAGGVRATGSPSSAAILSPPSVRHRKGFAAAAAAAAAAASRLRTRSRSAASAGNTAGGGATLADQPPVESATVVKDTLDTSASRAMHKMARPSLLSSDSAATQSYRGLFNLLAIVAVVSNVRLIVENFIKYGVLVGATWFARAAHTREDLTVEGILAFVGCVALNIVVAVAAETLCSWRLPHLGTALHVANCLGALTEPLAVGHVFGLGGFVSAAMVMFGTVVSMKLVSYAHACHDLRRRKASAYPGNVSVRDVAMFFAFPTLVYQTSYPRTARVRKRWLLKRVFELALTVSLMVIILEQFLVPTIRNASKPMKEMNLPRLLERLLKLAIPSLILWLMMFYGLFHVWLNIVAEVTHFGDRLFYKDWWEAKRLDVYWRHWNLPVHNWLVRHFFFPIMNWGFSKSTAATAVFLFSAAMHEFLVSAPFRIFRLWAFFGMMLQIPLIYITKELDRRLRGSQFEQVGNVVFWCSFCIVGQPLCILLYYFDLSQTE